MPSTVLSLATGLAAALAGTALLLPTADARTSMRGASVCPVPPPAANFTLQGYSGVWYEIGKVQTIGGAIFESSCVCTTLGIAQEGGSGNATALNSCRSYTPSGAYLNFTGQLIPQSASALPGRFIESFFPGSGVAYNVIALGTDPETGEDYSVEFDCGDTVLGLNYCIHLLSRKPTMSAALQAKLLSYAEDTLGLNLDNLPYKATNQMGCW